MTPQTLASNAGDAAELADDELDAVVGGLSRAFVDGSAEAPEPGRVRIPGLTVHTAPEAALRS